MNSFFAFDLYGTFVTVLNTALAVFIICLLFKWLRRSEITGHSPPKGHSS